MEGDRAGGDASGAERRVRRPVSFPPGWKPDRLTLHGVTDWHTALQVRLDSMAVSMRTVPRERSAAAHAALVLMRSWPSGRLHKEPFVFMNQRTDDVEPPNDKW